MSLARWLIVVAAMGLAACSGGGGDAAASAGQAAGGTPSTGGNTAVTFMGSSKLRIGGAMSEESAAAAPFDVRYAYVHSQPAPSAACYTAPKCTDACGGGWWGCWAGNTTAPGAYVSWWTDHVAQATWQGKPRPQTFLWTWYSLRDLGDAAGQGDGPAEVVAINRADLLTRYLDDYRFFLQKIGNAAVMIDLEPDFWGFARAVNSNPHLVPAQVSAANPTDCKSHENSAAGLAGCLVSMARTYAPNAKVGMHLSCWDWQSNTQGCGQYYLALGAREADFLVADVSDRDAGWYALPAHGGHDNFWTDQKAAAALGFYKSMAEVVGKPVVLWQIPLGNMAQNNTLNHYQDDKVDYFFTHLDQVADAHIAALLFGAGQQEQTSVETDGGNLIRRTIDYWNAGGTPLR